MKKLTPSEGYRWIAQDANGDVFKYEADPREFFRNCEWSGIQTGAKYQFIFAGNRNENWKESKVDTTTHDAYIVDGILVSKLIGKGNKMTTNKQTVTVDVPEGWEVVRYGRPKLGDIYTNSEGDVSECLCEELSLHRIIIRKKKPRTFNLNGVELPCPLSNLRTDYLIRIERKKGDHRIYNEFYFTESEYVKVFEEMERVLIDARDS